MIKLTIYFVSLYICLCTCDPIVHYNGGSLRGVSMETFSGRKISAFLGVPYAIPPIGEKRFEPPELVSPMTGEHNATEVAEDCLQYSQATYKVSSGIYGIEDCLYANVYTPNIPKSGNQDKLLDVYVYIHGGVFMFTYAHYGPKYLLDKDVVLVTFSYRLGPLGFLSTEDDAVPGNNGLKDQSMLLKWVNKHIRSFGGNPDSVTIAGTSAGSSSVHYHMLSPLSKGLFRNAFSMSGTTLIPWAQAKSAKEKAIALATELNCPTDNSQVIKNCLKKADGTKIVGFSKKIMPWLYLPIGTFGPVVEVDNDHAFITETPVDIMKQGKVHPVPWLVTVTSSEGLYPAADIAGDPKLMNELVEKWDTLAPLLLDYNYTAPNDKLYEVNERVKQKYFYEDGAGSDVTNMLRMASDRLFVEGVIKAANLHWKYNKSPAYSYYFSYRGKSSISDAMSNTKIDFGASHGDDTSYVLHNKYMNPEQSKGDIRMIKLLTQIWISFASTGKPKVDSIPDWPTINSNPNGGITYVHIKSPESLEIETKENLGNGKFWDSLELAENIPKDSQIRAEL